MLRKLGYGDGSPIRGERVQLMARQVLRLPGGRDNAVYFPLDCLVSAAITLHDGETVGIMTIGAEGMIGVSELLTSTASQVAVTVLVPGAAIRVDAASLREWLTTDFQFQQAVLHYLVQATERAAQAVACSRFHTIEQRCARWLLESSEAVRTDTLPVTHEQLAMMLGVRRPGLSLCLSHLQARAVIGQRRGSIVIRDRAGLGALACACRSESPASAPVDHPPSSRMGRVGGTGSGSLAH